MKGYFFAIDIPPTKSRQVWYVVAANLEEAEDLVKGQLIGGATIAVKGDLSSGSLATLREKFGLKDRAPLQWI